MGILLARMKWEWAVPSIVLAICMNDGGLAVKAVPKKSFEVNGGSV
jgi:hypothetical protein